LTAPSFPKEMVHNRRYTSFEITDPDWQKILQEVGFVACRCHCGKTASGGTHSTDSGSGIFTWVLRELGLEPEVQKV